MRYLIVAATLIVLSLIVTVLILAARSGGEPDCHPSYAVCLPLDRDVDCDEIPHRSFAVIGDDVYELDRNGDGVGCE